MNLADGAMRIFLNTRGTNAADVKPELVELLHYIEYTPRDWQYESPRVREIQERVNRIKMNHEIGVKYMKLWQMLEIADAKWEGKAEGNMQRLISQICKKLKKGNTIEEIADALEERVDLIKEICDIAHSCYPNYDSEQVYLKWVESHAKVS